MFYFRRRLNAHRPEFSPLRFTLTLILCTLVVLSTITMWWAERQLSGPIKEWARLRATTVATTAITSAMRDVLATRLEGVDTFQYRHGNDDKLPLISYNMGPLNRMMSDAVQAVADVFEGHDLNVFYIPVGEVTGLHLLAGYGPSIPARIHMTGGIEAEPKVDFRSAGINQVLHRLYLDITVRVVVVAPFLQDDILVKQSIIVSEEIIPGGIPDTYVNLVGYTGGLEEWLALLAAEQSGSGAPTGVDLVR